MSASDPPRQDAADATAPTSEATTSHRRRWRPFAGLSSNKRRAAWTAIGVGATIVVLVGASVGYAIYRNDQIHRIHVANLQKVPSSGVENILMVGSTSRCALAQQNAAFGLCSQGVNGVNSDVILILHLDPTRHRVSVLSIPRDTFIPNARPNETNRIDSALAYGPSQLVKAIEQDFGLPINHFVVLNFDSFQNVINSLGGIDMYFPNRVKDAYSSLNIRRTGCVHLDGFQALAVVRARHMEYKVNGKWYYDGTGDLGRIERDHEFLRVLATALSKRSLGNPLTDNAIFGAIAPQLEVDSGFSLHEMINLVLQYHSVNAGAAPELTLPVAVDPSFSYLYKGVNYGSIVLPVEPQDRNAISLFTKQPLPGRSLKPSSVTISLEGATGSPSGTAATAAQLAKLGYHVVATTEVPSVGPVSATDVLYSPGHLAQAERVLADLRGAVVLGEEPTSAGAEVTVVTGSDFSVAPAPGHTVAPTASTAALSTPATSASVGVLSARATLTSFIAGQLTSPTPARTSLPSYDPRACPSPPKHTTTHP